MSMTIESLWQCNPDIDEENAHKAYLIPDATLSQASLDTLVDHLCGRKCQSSILPRYVRAEGQRPAIPRALEFYSLDFSPQLLMLSCRAGFFCFGVEVAHPTFPLPQRAVLNLELAGPTRHPSPRGDTGGRIVLHGAAGMKVGRKTAQTVRPCSTTPSRSDVQKWVIAAREQPPQPVNGGKGEGGREGSKGRTEYVLTVNAAFETVWARLVQTHGTDWLGFENIRGAYHALHSSGQADGGVLPISIELWDGRTGELVSGEVGCVVGQAYSCLSLFADTGRYPRCDRVRVRAAVGVLARAGVNLFDAGTTANYFVDLFGFHRTTRCEFTDLWRRYRDAPIDITETVETVHLDLTEYVGPSEDHTRASDMQAVSTCTQPPPTLTPSAKAVVWISGVPANCSDVAVRDCLQKLGCHVVKVTTLPITSQVDTRAVTLRSPADVAALLPLRELVCDSVPAAVQIALGPSKRRQTQKAKGQKRGHDANSQIPTTETSAKVQKTGHVE